jgi:hypothetical protein
MEKEKLFSDDLLGNNATRGQEVSAKDTSMYSNRPPRRDEYHEGFILRGECL